MTVHNKYLCDECEGTGDMDCCECGQSTTCDECDGDGLNHETIDAAAFHAAKLAAFGHGMYRNMTIGDDWVGYTNDVLIVLFKDYAEPDEDEENNFGVADGGKRSLLEDLP